MARILEKAFDATKKIVRTVFLGSPNLFTTSDVNRQIEQVQSELDDIQKVLGIDSDFSVSWTGTQGSLSTLQGVATLSLTYAKANGVLFSPSYNAQENITLDYAEIQRKYFLLVAKKKTVTYADDFTHEIAGARFEDNTSKAAANQIVYFGEKVAVSDSPVYSDSTYFTVGVLGYLEYKEDSGVIYYSTCYDENTKVMQVVNEATALKSVDGIDKDVLVGDSYGVVIRKFIKGLQSLRSAFNSAEVTSKVLFDEQIPSESGSQVYNRYKMLLEGRNLFVRMRMIDQALGTFIAPDYRNLITKTLGEELYDLLPDSTMPICRYPLTGYDKNEDETHYSINGAYVSFYVRFDKDKANRTVRLYFFYIVESLCAWDSKGTPVSLTNKVLRTRSQTTGGYGRETYSLKLPITTL